MMSTSSIDSTVDDPSNNLTFVTVFNILWDPRILLPILFLVPLRHHGLHRHYAQDASAATGRAPKARGGAKDACSLTHGSTEGHPAVARQSSVGACFLARGGAAELRPPVAARRLLPCLRQRRRPCFLARDGAAGLRPPAATPRAACYLVRRRRQWLRHSRQNSCAHDRIPAPLVAAGPFVATESPCSACTPPLLRPQPPAAGGGHARLRPTPAAGAARRCPNMRRCPIPPAVEERGKEKKSGEEGAPRGGSTRAWKNK
jgi:hypothetical protein